MARLLGAHLRAGIDLGLRYRSVRAWRDGSFDDTDWAERSHARQAGRLGHPGGVCDVG